MSMLLFFSGESFYIELYHRRIPIIAGNTYQLSCRVRSNIEQTIRVQLDDNNGMISLSANPSIKIADTWSLFSFEFTGAITNSDSYLRFYPEFSAQDFYIDRVQLINLTQERKQYRIMRIQGSMVPGSFVQTLTLREKTPAEA